MSRHTRRSFLKGATALGLAGLGAAEAQGAAGGKRPNVIVLVADDHRYDALGCMGNPVIQTPHLDGLAKSGALFRNNFCTTSICCSSRASILTGLHTRSHGILQFNQDLAPEDLAMSYPVQLREAGYRTGFVGKYGIGRKMPESAFDYWAGFPGQGKYFFEVDGQEVHMTDHLRGKALEFLKECTADEPFCLSVSFKAPHTMDYNPRPWQPAPRFDALYQDATIPVPPTADEAHYDALPTFLKDSEGRKRWENRFRTPERFQETMRDYYRLLTGVDEAIGAMVETLRTQGLADNTVIVYTGDNGFYLGERGLAGKWYAHEVSIRTPLIIHDPRAQAPQRVAEDALSIDLAPTVLDLAGLPVPERMQGRSLAPLLKGKHPRWRKDWFYEHNFTHKAIPRSEAVRTNKWKYIRWMDFDPPQEELYDLTNDPHEEHNLATDPAHTATLKRLRQRWQELRDSVPEAVLRS